MNGGRAYSVRVEGAKYGASFGSALAMAISYTTNHSILWAIIHGIFSWLYVLYFALSCAVSQRKAENLHAALWSPLFASSRNRSNTPHHPTGCRLK